MTDLKSFVPSDTYTFTVKNPVTGKPILKDDEDAMTITVYSPYSDKFRTVAHEQAKKRIALSKDDKADKELTPADYQDFSISTLAETTESWDVVFDGKPVPFSVEKAKEIYKTLPWLKEQASEAQDRIGNFIKS